MLKNMFSYTATEISVKCNFDTWNCTYSTPTDARMNWDRVARGKDGESLVQVIFIENSTATMNVS